MDTLDSMRMFVAVTEMASFTAAAERLGLSKNIVSKAVAELESRLGTRLLHRTTRALSLTDAGHRYLGRCKQLLSDLEALEDSISSDETQLRGTLRVTAPTTFGELYVVNAAAEFCREHSGVTIDLRLSDRYVDLVTEGFDLGIRIGHLMDSGLVARKLGSTKIWVVGAPEFISKFGEPVTPADLCRFNCVRDTNFRAGNAWQFVVDGVSQDIAVEGPVLVNSARSGRDIARCGLALAYCPDYVVRNEIERGELLQLLADYPTVELPIHAIYPSNRHVSSRLRAFVAFLSEQLCKNWQPQDTANEQRA